jgi:hypothetical protein
MGEGRIGSLRVHFDSKVKLEFHGARVSSDGGLLAYRELDEALGLTAMADECLRDTRPGSNVQHRMVPLLRQSIYGRLAGYEDLNDAERLRVDPVIRRVVGGRATIREAASTSEMGRFETAMLTQEENLNALTELSGRWIDQANGHTEMKKIVLDLDSSESPVYGQQEGSAYNGHFGCDCYHPLFCFNQFGDLERASLRNGNVHSAQDWRSVLEPVVARYRDRPLERFFRADAAFANPEVYTFLEEERFGYAILIPANEVLEREIADLLIRPVGRPSLKPKVLYASFTYRAESWTRFRRVVAKVEWHTGELFPRVGFIVTSLMWDPPERVVRFYNRRGTAEQWIKEGKYAVKWTRLSCHDFRDNEVRLQLFALAYNLGNFLRRLALPNGVKYWTLTTLREKLVKIGAKVVRHARYVVFQMAEVAIPRRLFATILRRISRLCPVPI